MEGFHKIAEVGSMAKQRMPSQEDKLEGSLYPFFWGVTVTG
jgi:hypothetical protein